MSRVTPVGSPVSGDEPGQRGEPSVDESPPLPPMTEHIARTLLDPLNHGFAAGVRTAMTLGVPAERVIEMYLNHLGSVVAMIEPPGARELALTEIVSSFAPIVQKHLESRHRTPGGVWRPSAGIGVTK